MDYRPRVADAQLRERLRSAGAVLIEGPKACGKTWTARQAASSEVLLDVDQNAQRALDVDPGLILAGDTPRLIDEWQIGGSTLWNHVRRAVDDRQHSGQFILTGSSTPADNITRHSGAGRFARIAMRPMSLHEIGASSDQISISELFAGGAVSCPDPGLGVRDVVDLIAIGGWPANLTRSIAAALRANVDYLAQAQEVDIPAVSGLRRDPARMQRLFASLARNIATEVSVATLARESAEADESLARTTVYDYLSALDRLMLVADVPAWSAHLRSRASLRKQPKRHFVDPSLAVAALRVDPARLLADLEYTGLLFESLVARDLRALSSGLDATLSHYRDSDRLEVDLVLHLPDGRWGAIEVKLGSARLEEAAASLIRLRDKVDSRRTPSPAFLAIVTGMGYGYVRSDGVAVIPIAALAP